MESDAPSTKGRTVSVEPAQQGVDIKPVRQKKPLTEAQLAALKRGRDKLAERRAKERGEETATVVQQQQLQEQEQQPEQQPEQQLVAAPPGDLKPVPTDAAVQTDAPLVNYEKQEQEEEEDDSGGGMCMIM
jgi:hypothetical protein